MAGEAPDDVRLSDLPPSEVARIEARVAKHTAARREYYKGSFGGLALVGGAGLAANFLAIRYHAPYRKLYVGIKTLLVTSTFAMGWWVGGERSFQQWHRREFDVLANRKRKALAYMAEHRETHGSAGGGAPAALAVAAPAPLRSTPQMSPTLRDVAAPTMPNVKAASPLP